MIEFHPYAGIFDLLKGRHFDELVEDVRTHGIRKRIVVLDGQILDGRNRYLAGIKAGLIDESDAPDDRPGIFGRFVPDVDGNPLKYVMSLNLYRRHLDASQRSYAIAEYESFSHGGHRRRQDDQDANLQLDGMAADRPETRAELADKAGVSERSVASAAVVRDHGVDELKSAVKEGDIAVSKAEQIARMPEQEQREEVARVLPNGHRAVMGSRIEPEDSLDFLPTPPWATRALMEQVFPAVGFRSDWAWNKSVWEPACGEGHIAEVLAEYFKVVSASDIHDYGYAVDTIDFLSDIQPPSHDWIITNPPFDDKAEKFAARALELAHVGVAIFVPLRWLETIGRYERLFSKQPPTLISFFAERVNLCKGRWDPEGSTATAYIWLVWVKGQKPRAPFWIPPGQREALTRPDDVARFTAHPVIKRESLPPHDPETGEILESPAGGDCGRIEPAPDVTRPPPGAGSSINPDDFEIPEFLRRAV